ncbi:1-acyl-sn-glycerol-3-phosphate acyltransferase [hydrothermal vent metagenome]|uniref:1-acyl-sn-glycerol-3-phosphate acyltransferase n=1 Tax=hydrothermal vent metagenome TaxID=652676 RepID=A0A3B0Z3W8_9ZZZZ
MNNKKLLADSHFRPLFWTQFCGALNDNLFKLALVTLVLSQAKGYLLWGLNTESLVILSTGIFILPFFLFSTIAGQLADKYDKARLIRYIKWLEIGIMCFAAIGFITENIGFLVIILFLMGTQSTLFGPLKYSILPQHLPAQSLVAANGLIEMATFLAILLGTILGGVLILMSPGGTIIVSISILTVAVIGYLFSCKIPDAAPCAPHTVIRYNFIAETFSQLAHARHNRDVFNAIVAISWFWYVGATLLTLLPPISEEFQASNYLYTILLTFLSLGIGLGSILCDKLMGSLKSGNFLVPIGALGLVIFAIDFYFAATHMVAISPSMIDHTIGDKPLVSVGSFMSSFTAWRILIDLTLFGMSAGFYIVPLYVILQQRSDEQHRSRMIAVNNILNALFIVVSVVAGFILKRWFSLNEIILITALISLIVYAIIFTTQKEFMQELKSRLSH